LASILTTAFALSLAMASGLRRFLRGPGLVEMDMVSNRSLAPGAYLAAGLGWGWQARGPQAECGF
jgi:hypothetical protein